MRRVLALALALGWSAAAQADPRAQVLIVGLDDATADTLRRDFTARGFVVVTPRAPSDATAEEALAAARPLYRDMAFGRAVQRLTAEEAALLQDRLPTPRTLQVLAEIEAWIGALQLLNGKAADAGEHLALAHRLDPAIEPDPIFPPEVRLMLRRAAATTAAPLPIATKLAPAGARLWLDGALVDGPLTATPGLHDVVVERADRRPFARVVRLTRAAPQIAVSLDVAPPEQALRQVAARAAQAPLTADEGLAVAELVGHPLVVVTPAGLDRFDAHDGARPVVHVDAGAAPERLVEAWCQTDRACAPAPPAAVAVAATPAAAPAPTRPWYRRAAFWIPVGAGVVVIVGAGILAGTLAHSSSDYVVRIR
jgi:hypothetical protein